MSYFVKDVVIDQSSDFFIDNEDFEQLLMPVSIETLEIYGDGS